MIRRPNLTPAGGAYHIDIIRICWFHIGRRSPSNIAPRKADYVIDLIDRFGLKPGSNLEADRGSNCGAETQFKSPDQLEGLGLTTPRLPKEEWMI